jgi:hypothetical protein
MTHWIWKALGWAIATVLATGVALWIYKKQSYKALTYQVISISPLGPLQARGFADLRMLKGDKPIERPFLTSIRIVNTGDLSISAADFANPLSIRPIGPGVFRADFNIKPSPWSESSVSIFKVPYKMGQVLFTPQVVDARVAGTSPPKIPVELVVKGDQLLIQPLLLNAGDEITVEILINGDVGGIEVGARIAGIKGISEEKQLVSGAAEIRKHSSDSFHAALLAMIAGIVFAFVGSIRISKVNQPGKEWRIPPTPIDIAVLLSSLIAVAFVARAFWYSEKSMSDVTFTILCSLLSVLPIAMWLRSR